MESTHDREYSDYPGKYNCSKCSYPVGVGTGPWCVCKFPSKYHRQYDCTAPLVYCGSCVGGVSPIGPTFRCPTPGCLPSCIWYVSSTLPDKCFVGDKEINPAYIERSNAVCSSCKFAASPQYLLEHGFPIVVVDLVQHCGLGRIRQVLEKASNVNLADLRTLVAVTVLLSDTRGYSVPSIGNTYVNAIVGSCGPKLLKGLFNGTSCDFFRYGDDVRAFKRKFAHLARAICTVLVMTAGAGRIDRNIARKITGMSF